MGGAAAVVTFSVVAILSFSSSASAQLLPVPTAAQPAIHSAAVLRSADHCLLLTPEMCDGLPADRGNAWPEAPAPNRSARSWTVGRVVSRLAHDQASIYAAPFQRANFKWDAVFLVGTAALIATDRHTIGIVSQDDINISRDISNVGLYGSEAAAGAIFITGLVTDNAHAKETGYLTAEALINAFPVYAGVQLIAGRERPNQGVGHGRFFQDHATSTSFPSGHAMFTWTIAAVIAHEYPRTWVKVLVYSTAAAVSVARYTGREHFVSDVAVGSFFGYFIGRHIFNSHCSSDYDNNCHR
jgi:membrane-associated phospholipid phosphatase